MQNSPAMFNLIKKIKNLLIKFVLLLGIFFLIWVAGLGVQIAQFSEQSSSNQADAAVVLGAAVYRGLPSPVFRERINHAIRLYQSGQVAAIIFTGGVGSRDTISEGEAARQYALSAGIPEEAIYIETTSLNTYQNLVNAQQIISEQDFKHVLVVSDPLHMRRAMTLAEDIGMEAEPSPTTTSRYRSFEARMRFLFREAYFLTLYRLFPGVLI
jgi:uncharacterized SAM-binding protein YcdF (DUF218 family)